MARTFAAWTHAAQADERDALRLGLAAPLRDRDGAAALRRRNVEREGIWRSDVRLSEAAEEDAQEGVGIGRRAHGGTDVGTDPLLVDDDGRREPFQNVHVGPPQTRHEPLDECAVGPVNQALRLCRDRTEDKRALPRSGYAREHGEPALRDL